MSQSPQWERIQSWHNRQDFQAAEGRCTGGVLSDPRIVALLETKELKRRALDQLDNALLFHPSNAVKELHNGVRRQLWKIVRSIIIDDTFAPESTATQNQLADLQIHRKSLTLNEHTHTLRELMMGGDTEKIDNVLRELRIDRLIQEVSQLHPTNSRLHPPTTEELLQPSSIPSTAPNAHPSSGTQQGPVAPSATTTDEIAALFRTLQVSSSGIREINQRTGEGQIVTPLDRECIVESARGFCLTADEANNAIPRVEAAVKAFAEAHHAENCATILSAAREKLPKNTEGNVIDIRTLRQQLETDHMTVQETEDTAEAVRTELKGALDTLMDALEASPVHKGSEQQRNDGSSPLTKEEEGDFLRFLHVSTNTVCQLQKTLIVACTSAGVPYHCPYNTEYAKKILWSLQSGMMLRYIHNHFPALLKSDISGYEDDAQDHIVDNQINLHMLYAKCAEMQGECPTLSITDFYTDYGALARNLTTEAARMLKSIFAMFTIADQYAGNGDQDATLEESHPIQHHNLHHLRVTIMDNSPPGKLQYSSSYVHSTAKVSVGSHVFLSDGDIDMRDEDQSTVTDSNVAVTPTGTITIPGSLLGLEDVMPIEPGSQMNTFLRSQQSRVQEVSKLTQDVAHTSHQPRIVEIDADDEILKTAGYSETDIPAFNFRVVTTSEIEMLPSNLTTKKMNEKLINLLRIVSPPFMDSILKTQEDLHIAYEKWDNEDNANSPDDPPNPSVDLPEGQTHYDSNHQITIAL